MGDDPRPESRPAHTVNVNAFRICRVAVTCLHFAPFILDGGYEDEALWSAMGWRWRSGKDERAPAFWADPRFNRPNHPVVGVSWYEAQAFAAWLARRSGLPWRLPTEAEWESAARGPTDLPPPDPMRINSAERGFAGTVSVTWQGNVAWCGALNLLGNVWEWTATRWGRNWQSLDYPYPYDAADGREDPGGSHARVMRGGSWFDSIHEAHPAARARYLPGSRGSNIGFRLVCPA